MSVGADFLACLLQQGDQSDVSLYVGVSKLLSGADAEVYNYILGFLSNHGKIPSIQTVVEVFPTYEEVLTSEKPENLSFYSTEVKTAYLYQGMHNTLKQYRDALEQDPYQVETLIQTLGMEMLNLKVANKPQMMIDFGENAAALTKKYIQDTKSAFTKKMVYTGWPTFDSMAGGVGEGDLFSIVGRPGMGKTFLLLKICDYAVNQQKLNGLFVSLEMKPESLIPRLAALFTSTNLTKLQKAQVSTKKEKMLLDELEQYASNRAAQSGHSNLWILDGNQKITAEDIHAYASQLKPDFICIDGAYLLGSSKMFSNKYDRVAHNVEWLKANIAGELAIPTLCSWQLNRESEKNATKGKKVKGVSGISFSDEIGQISSVVLGLFEEEDEVESLHERIVRVLKGRNGESGEFRINWDFESTNLDELSEYPEFIL